MLLCAVAIVGGVAASAAGALGSRTRVPFTGGRGVDPANFVPVIDNPYFPLTPGTTLVYEGTSDGQRQHDEMTVTHRTKVILGIRCTVVTDVLTTPQGALLERTEDWYAQDHAGNVWYFGEDTAEYEDGIIVSTEGSWKAGVDGAEPGILMQAHPGVPSTYRQEFYRGHAEDMAWVVSSTESVTIDYGSFDHVLLTIEWTRLEPKVIERKYYARGIGVIREVTAAGANEQSDLVAIRTEATGT